MIAKATPRKQTHEAPAGSAETPAGSKATANKKPRKPAKLRTAPKAASKGKPPRSAEPPADLQKPAQKAPPEPPEDEIGRPAAAQTIRAAARRSARLAIRFLKATFIDTAPPWHIRLGAAKELLAQCHTPVVPPGHGKAKSKNPDFSSNAKAEVDVAAQCRAALRDINGVMASHANTKMDLAEQASDPDRLLE
jgi:hypothetical protein